MKDIYNRWIEETLRINRHVRDSKWTQRVAVGGKEFVEMTKDRLGYRAEGRKVVKSGEDYQWNDPLKLHKSEQVDQSAPRGVRGWFQHKFIFIGRTVSNSGMKPLVVVNIFDKIRNTFLYIFQRAVGGGPKNLDNVLSSESA